MSNPQKMKPSCLLTKIKSLCLRIIDSCEQNEVDDAIDMSDKLCNLLKKIDKKAIMSSGKQEAVELINILRLVQKANWIIATKNVAP